MDEVNHFNRNCNFCGKEISYTISHSDGVDWLGHHRSSSASYTNGYDCECDEVKFKKMCLNCKYYNELSCNNKKVIEEHKKSLEQSDSPFCIESIKISIKKPTNSCKCWAISDEIVNKIFK